MIVNSIRIRTIKIKEKKQKIFIKMIKMSVIYLKQIII